MYRFKSISSQYSGGVYIEEMSIDPCNKGIEADFMQNETGKVSECNHIFNPPH
jgi:hypothetical protein